MNILSLQSFHRKTISYQTNWTQAAAHYLVDQPNKPAMISGEVQGAFRKTISAVHQSEDF